MPDPISTGIGAAAGLAQTITGLVNKGKAKREARELERTRPTYQISDLVQQDLDLAESEAASGGLSSRAETAYNNLNDKQFSSSLGAILRSGGSVNNVADVFGANDEGRQRLALISDQARLNQINNLTRSRMNMVNEQDKEFLYNVDQPWKNKAAANAEARRSADAGIWSGIDTVAGAGMQYFGNKYNEDRYNNSLKLSQPAPPQQAKLDLSWYKPPMPQDSNPYELDWSWNNQSQPQDINPYGG